MNDLLAFFRASQQLYAACPNAACPSHSSRQDRLIPLARVGLHYEAAPADDFVGRLAATARELDRREADWEQRREETKASAIASRRAQVASEIGNRGVTLLGKLGLGPSDLRPILHPIDAVAFVGYPNAPKPSRTDCLSLTKIRLLDRAPASREAERLHESLRASITKGNFGWRTFWIAPGRTSSGKLRQSKDPTTISVDLFPAEGPAPESPA